jgi:hypothetical protein
LSVRKHRMRYAYRKPLAYVSQGRMPLVRRLKMRQN